MKKAGDDLRGVALNQLTGIGSSIVGGYRGLSTLLSGGSMDDAANNVREYQDAHTYQGTAAGHLELRIPRKPDELAGAGCRQGRASHHRRDRITRGWCCGQYRPERRCSGSRHAWPSWLRSGGSGPGSSRNGHLSPGWPDFRPPNPALPAPGEPMCTVPQELPQNAPGQPVRVCGEPGGSPVPVPTTPEALQAVAQSAPAKLFPETPTTAPAGRFAPHGAGEPGQDSGERRDRPNKLRRSAVSGDGTGGSTDFQTAKLDSAAGREMKAIIDGEKSASRTTPTA
jgi:hypothetical protein